MKYILLLLLIFSSPALIFGQEFIPTKKQERKLRPKYIEIGIGLDYSYFCDFATSPLIYKGMNLQYSLGYLSQSKEKESFFNIYYSSGTYNNIENEITLTSHTMKGGLTYHKLTRIKKISGNKWNFKIGGMINLTGNLRNNPSLGNAVSGLEFVNTIFTSLKAERYFERKETKPRRYCISYQLNLPLMNNTFRNGYAYVPNAIGNDPTLFKDYKVKYFSGCRLNSKLEFYSYLHNNNAIKISYIWDAYKTGGHFDKFQMANHFVQLSLLFKLNN